MTKVADKVLDAALDEFDGATALHICSAEPSNRATALSLSLGNKASPSIGAQADSSSPAGRKRTVAAITDGTVTATGTASYWAIIDGTDLLATNTLSPAKAVADGGTFTLSSFDIVAEDATSL
jgi:hypothetical protein